MASAAEHFYREVKVTRNITADGIKVDGSFLQHNAQLYTGNYGKDFINSVAKMLVLTIDTPYVPCAYSRSAFKKLLEGTEWMIISNSSHNLLWEYSTIGRMISFPTSEHQASGGVAINLTQITAGTSTWKEKDAIKQVVHRLQTKSTNANQGQLVGTRHFYRSDYMSNTGTTIATQVHRGTDYVVTLKMFSTRTNNSECNNNQNPFGFHLSDGAIFNYVSGDEYVDVFGAWDWNLVPGTTVHYNTTPLSCNETQWTGLEPFVGGVTLGNVGVAVMNYTNPYVNDPYPHCSYIHWQKSYFFFPNAYAVMLGNLTTKFTCNQILTTLDQRNLNGPVYIDGALIDRNETIETVSTHAENGTVWHDRVGYTLVPHWDDLTVEMFVNTATHRSNWASIGIAKNNETVPMFTATVLHYRSTLDYIVQPAISETAFHDTSKGLPLKLLTNYNHTIMGAYSAQDRTLGLTFWEDGFFSTGLGINVTSNHPIVLILQEKKSGWLLAVADPSQLLKRVRLEISSNRTEPVKVKIDLPQGQLAGSTVIHEIK
ncbi:hypothetical protein EC973_006963 [Apophysomyces ossiformis]|uniref:Uncharacterized protein n=1 Tax=Apophysomyces ossiformis TaxID=679940 RepID=A0A8H7BSJ3_9FUNG|nr:hypothetical protein EC973_006963 [Apophysomyces ossiformis]